MAAFFLYSLGIWGTRIPSQSITSLFPPLQKNKLSLTAWSFLRLPRGLDL